MRRFELLEPTSLAEACKLLVEREDSKLIAGGTALLILIKQGIYFPTTLVNLKKVRAADAISYDPGRGLRIGALASIFDVETHPDVVQHYPVLAQACHVVANIRIRNLATIGGNLAHADGQSDPPAALLAYDARVELTSAGMQREVPLADFLLDSYETSLRPGEVLSAVLVPPMLAGLRGSYLKFTTRSAEDRPCVGITALAQIKDGVCHEARLVVGAVSSTPVRIHGAEQMAKGERLTPALIQQMAEVAARQVDPIDDLRGTATYKRQVTTVLARRSLEACIASGAVQ